MKKSLVALAALAVVGAASAQVSLTGNYTAGWTYDSSSSSVVVNGLHTDTADIAIEAKEDLGGGTSAVAHIGAGGFNRGSSVGGEDAYLTVGGGFGSVKMGSTESGMAYDVSTPGGGQGFDGNVFSGNVTNDNLTYSLPSFGATTVSVGYADYSATANSAGGNGNDGSAASQASVNVAVSYAAGPLSVVGKVNSYKNNEIAVNNKQSRYIARVAYDMGVANVGLSVASTKYAQSDASLQTQLGVAVPVGNLTLSAKYATNKDYSSAAASGAAATKSSGYVLAGDYSITKTVGLGVSAYSWSVDGTSGTNTGYRVLLGKSF